jgi:hypothetical protein
MADADPRTAGAHWEAGAKDEDDDGTAFARAMTVYDQVSRFINEARLVSLRPEMTGEEEAPLAIVVLNGANADAGPEAQIKRLREQFSFLRREDFVLAQRDDDCVVQPRSLKPTAAV